MKPFLTFSNKRPNSNRQALTEALQGFQDAAGKANGLLSLLKGLAVLSESGTITIPHSVAALLEPGDAVMIEEDADGLNTTITYVPAPETDGKDS